MLHKDVVEDKDTRKYVLWHIYSLSTKQLTFALQRFCTSPQFESEEAFNLKLAQTHLLLHIYQPDHNIGKHVVHSYLLNSYFHNTTRFLLCFLEVAITEWTNKLFHIIRFNINFWITNHHTIIWDFYLCEIIIRLSYKLKTIAMLWLISSGKSLFFWECHAMEKYCEIISLAAHSIPTLWYYEMMP